MTLKHFADTIQSGFLSGGGWGEHSLFLGFGLPPLGNFDLKVNQFKCFEIFNSCTMHNKSLKYCMYIHSSYIANNPSSFSTPYSDHHF